MLCLTFSFATCISSCLQKSEEPIYTVDFSKQPVTTYSGGWYKSSNVRNFPASDNMSGALVSLSPGGLREPHWHQPDEWAYVVNGTCRWRCLH